METVAAPRQGRGTIPAALGAALLAWSLASCAPGRVVDGAYVNRSAGFRVPVPAAPWAPVSLPDVDIAFQHPGTAATIAVFSECDGAARGPLRVLARRLLFGLRSEVVEQSPVALDGAEALRTVARGTLDSRPVVVESLVVRRGGCVYDMVLTAAPGDYPVLRPDFDRLTAGWRPLP